MTLLAVAVPGETKRKTGTQKGRVLEGLSESSLLHCFGLASSSGALPLLIAPAGYQLRAIQLPLGARRSVRCGLLLFASGLTIASTVRRPLR